MEVRSEQYATAIEASEQLMNRFEDFAKQARVAIKVTNIERRESMSYVQSGVELALQVAKDEGISAVPIKTISGHDSVAMNEKYFTIMLFVPSHDGYAHSPKELTDAESQIQGLHELFAVVCKLLSRKSR